ncbi:MAG: TPR domain-containing protein [Nitrospiria bacterium]
MMFLVYAGLLLTGVTLFLVYPIWSGAQNRLLTGKEAALDEERTNLGIEKQSLLTSLSELDLDDAQGKFSEQDFLRLKLDYEQRLVKVLERIKACEPLQKNSRQKSAPLTFSLSGYQWAFSLILALCIISGTTGAYKLVYGKIERGQQAATEEGGPGIPSVNPAEMVARLEKRLKENPNDLQGQMMAGRSYMALQRWADAEKAWRKAVELDERNEAAQYSLADLLIRTAPPGNKTVYEEALDHLERALINVPREPVVLWAKGVALVHLGRNQEADQAWTAAFQNLPPGSQDAEYVKKALQELRAGKTPPE